MRRAPIKWWRSDSMLCYLFYGHASLRIYHHKFSHHQQRAINRATGLAKQRNGMQHQECRIKISWAPLLLIQLVVQLSNYWLTCRGQGQLSTEHTQCSSLPWFTTPHRTLLTFQNISHYHCPACEQFGICRLMLWSTSLKTYIRMVSYQ